MWETTGAGAIGSSVHMPALPGSGLLHDWPGGQDASAQHTSSTQLPERQSVGSAHVPPFGSAIRVGVTLGEAVEVPVAV